MKASAVASALALAAALASCADRLEDGVVSVPLAATSRNAGEIGQAYLIPRGPVTDVIVDVSGVPPLVATRPVHLYTFLYGGRCDDLPPKPLYALTDRVLAQSVRTTAITPVGGPFRIANTAPFPLETLRRGPHAIVIRTSPADGSVDIFCGNIAASRSEGGPAPAAGIQPK